MLGVNSWLILEKVVTFIGKSVCNQYLFAWKNVIILIYSVGKVWTMLVYSLEKMYFCIQTNMKYDAEKKNRISFGWVENL